MPIVAFLFVKISFALVQWLCSSLRLDGASHPLYGLAYGLESAVVNFNRFPQLGVAMARRTCLAFCAAYFDDELGVEFTHQSNVSQLGLRHCFKLMGAPPQDSKAFEASFDRHFLGTSVHTAEFALSGTIRFQPKLQTTSKIIGRLDQALALKHLDRDTAGKLRGDLNWMFSHCAGNIGKFAGPLLNTIQQEAPAILSKSFTSCSTSSFSPPLWMFGSLAGHL